MKVSSLQKILEDAKIFATIEITFNDCADINNVDAAVSMLMHFNNAGRIAILRSQKNLGKGAVKIAKTPIFKPQDAKELASWVAKAVSSAVARDIPEHTITLEECENHWQLKVEGGNSFLRGTLKHMVCKTLPDSHIVTDKEGKLEVRFSDDYSEDTILQFAEIMADTFEVQLTI